MCRPNRSPMSGRRACFFGKPYAKRLFSATSFGGGPVSTSKMAKLPGAFCIFGKLVGVSFLQFSGGHSCTRLLVSSGLFFVLPCLSKNSRTARSIHEIPWIAPAEASRPPTSQNYRVLQAKMAVGTKKPSFFKGFAQLILGLLSAPSGCLLAALARLAAVPASPPGPGPAECAKRINELN